jgi:hypothetical protein
VRFHDRQSAADGLLAGAFVELRKQSDIWIANHPIDLP